MSLSDDEYLNFFRINDSKYLIGIFQDGITVHKQQIRALNIFHALFHSKLKHSTDENYVIGVIGGGVAGLTFAAAALKAGFKVILFERQPIYLHMQFGCEVRKIHPNLYEWPDRNYNNPYAELPVLDWKHGSASNVVKQIIREWEAIKAEVLKKNKKGHTRLMEITNCTISSIKQEPDANDRMRYAIKYKSNAEFGNEDCDLLIYATGYGVEKGVREKAKTPSYWRNDELSQIELGKPDATYVISGVGDGGLIDLFRLKIFDFSYELILRIIEEHEDFPDLLKKLSDIKADILKNKLVRQDALYRRFKAISQDFYHYIYKALKEQGLFRENTIWLNDRFGNFEDSLDHKKLSFLHAFLIFILEKHGPELKIEYKGGELAYDKTLRKYRLNGELLPSGSKVIIRHGTDRENSIPAKYFTDTEKDIKMEDIRTLQKAHYSHGQVSKRWSNSELNAIFNPSTGRKFEYLNGDTTVLCTNYITGLSNHLKIFLGEGVNFRMSLHRLIYVKGEYCFQQVTSYFGSGAESSGNPVGQVFPVSRGNVGLSFKTGQPVLLINSKEAHFNELIEKMELNPDLDKLRRKKTFFTYPILAKTTFAQVTNLVLFFDADEDLFTGREPEERKKLLNIIRSSTLGFVEAINHYTQRDLVRMVETDFEPLPAEELPEWLQQNDCFSDITALMEDLEKGLAGKTLDGFHTFNIIS